jgi:hypothetical protein
LLATERRLEERLRAARAERDQVIARAQAAAESRERAVAAELELEQRRLADGLEAERRQGEQDIAAAAERQAAAFEGIPPESVAAIARDLALRFFAGKAAP